MNCCGTLGRKVVVRAAISGRLRAAAINLLRFFARNCNVASGAVFEDEREAAGVPTPGMAGGENAKAMPLEALA